MNQGYIMSRSPHKAQCNVWEITSYMAARTWQRKWCMGQTQTELKSSWSNVHMGWLWKKETKLNRDDNYVTRLNIYIINTTDKFRNLSAAMPSAGMHMPWVTYLWLTGPWTGCNACRRMCCCCNSPTIFMQRRRPRPRAALSVVQPAECQWWPQTT